MANHLEVDELEQGRRFDVCTMGSAWRRLEGLGGPTHILAANFGAAFFQTVLDVFPLVALVVPQASDEVVQRFLEPGWHQHGGSGWRWKRRVGGHGCEERILLPKVRSICPISAAHLAASRPGTRCSRNRGSSRGRRGVVIVEIGLGRGSAAGGSVGNDEVWCGKTHLAGGIQKVLVGGLRVEGWGLWW